jgi:hypothetical protein
VKEIIKNGFLVFWTSAMTAATFWPLLFDLAEWITVTAGYEPKYIAFYLMPWVFYVCALMFLVLIMYLSGKAILSILTIFAAYASPYGQVSKTSANTLTVDYQKASYKNQINMAHWVIIFMTVFSLALLTLHSRFANVSLNNKVEQLESQLRTVNAQLNNAEE